MDQYQKIKELYAEEYNKYKHYIHSPFQEPKIHDFLHEVSKIEYDNIVIELAPTSCKIQILIKEYLIMISQPYITPMDIKENMLIFSVFQDKELLLSNIIAIEDLYKFNNLNKI